MSRLYEYTLWPKSRVSAGSRGQVGNERPAHTVIPGSAIRGALGATWWNSPEHHFKGGDKLAEFDRFFGESLSVRLAKPKGAELVPLADFKCKYPEPGCSATEFQRRGATDQKLSCDCRSGTIEGRGWMTPLDVTVATSRTALRTSRDTDGHAGTAKDGALFTRMALRHSIDLQGTFKIDDNASAAALDWLRTVPSIRVGGQLSSMGDCDLEVGELQERPVDSGAVLITLRSPAMLLDEFGGPLLDLKSAVEAATGRTIDPRHVWQRPTLVSGWHGVAGLLKPQDWAIAAGSCVAISDMTADEAEKLRLGLGIRRLEGYGEVDIMPAQRSES